MEGIIKTKNVIFCSKFCLYQFSLIPCYGKLNFQSIPLFFIKIWPIFIKIDPKNWFFVFPEHGPKLPKTIDFLKNQIFGVFSIFRWFLPPQSRQNEYEKPDFRCFKLKNIIFIEISISETWFLAQNPIHIIVLFVNALTMEAILFFFAATVKKIVFF